MQDSIRQRQQNSDEKVRSSDSQPDPDDINAFAKYLVEKNRCVLDMLEKYDRRRVRTTVQD